MLQSHIIDIDGIFVGAAVRLDRGYRFIATDMRLDDLDGSIWPKLSDVVRLARQHLTGSLRAEEFGTHRLDAGGGTLSGGVPLLGAATE